MKNKRNNPNSFKRRKVKPITKSDYYVGYASEVVVTKIDGSIEIVSPKTKNQMIARPVITKVMRTEIWRRDKYRCRYCLKRVKLNDFHLDHIVPFSAGGRTDHSNLVTACSTCNLKKGIQKWNPQPIWNKSQKSQSI